MTVTGKNGKEQQPGRVVRVRGLDQRCVLLDDDGNRITRFDNIIRYVEGTGAQSWPTARVMLAWQRHAWQQDCHEDYLGLIWDDAMERVVDELLGIFMGAVLSHLRDDFDRVGVEEEVHGLLDAMLNQPAPRPLRSDTVNGQGAACECGCDMVAAAEPVTITKDRVQGSSIAAASGAASMGVDAPAGQRNS